ncbi:MAG: hypothetical protein IJN23_07120, partial [Akkermansia sp.]|nr:hypothetical protein [Akkermansia sp.]
ITPAVPVYVNTAARSGMKAQLALCMKYMPAACMKSLTLTHEGLEFGLAKFHNACHTLILDCRGVFHLHFPLPPVSKNTPAAWRCGGVERWLRWF